MRIAVLCLIWIVSVSNALWAADDPVLIAAGLKSHARALHIKDGWIRDPYIILAPDGYYYLTGTTALPDSPREKAEPFNKGLGPESVVGWKVRVWRSSDLIQWEYLGEPFTLKDGIWSQVQPERFQTVLEREWRLWAPELHWLGDRWALVHTSPSPVRASNLALTRGPELKGPWDNPMGEKIQHRHDPSLFRDEDGTWWLIWGATQIAPLLPDFSDFAREPITIGPAKVADSPEKMGHEGCFMRKLGKKYVLFGTGWSTQKIRRGSYNLYYATADRIEGPYTPRRFVGRFLGHGTLFQDKDGQWWCTAFFNADVPPLTREEARGKDLSETAQTINPQGVTIVPMHVEILPDGDVFIRAKDPDYANPGPDEVQKFDLWTPRG